MHADPGSTVLVTGGTGFVGSHLVERLVGLGYRVRCLIRRTSSLKYLPTGAVELVYGELATGAGLHEAVQGVRTVFHVAGVTKANSARDYYRGNLRATDNLLRAIVESGSEPPRLVHVSTLAAMGPSPDGNPIAEDFPPRPLTHYGRSKLEAEEALRNSPLAPYAVIVRPPVVYGPRDTDVFQVFQTVRRGFMLQIGRQERFFSLIHVQDLVEGLLVAAHAEYGQARAYFMAQPQPASWTEFASTAAEVMGRRLITVPVPLPAAYGLAFLVEIGSWLRGKPSIISREKVREAQCRFWTCDTSRARLELGFSPQKSLRDGIAETLNWYKMVGWLKW